MKGWWLDNLWSEHKLTHAVLGVRACSSAVHSFFAEFCERSAFILLLGALPQGASTAEAVRLHERAGQHEAERRRVEVGAGRSSARSERFRREEHGFILFDNFNSMDFALVTVHCSKATTPFTPLGFPKPDLFAPGVAVQGSNRSHG